MVDTTGAGDAYLGAFAAYVAAGRDVLCVAPTGRPVEVALVAIVRFRDGKVAHEHIYWDQASVLAQIGLLDPALLPIVGVEGARKVVDKTLPSNGLMQAAWKTSEGRPI